MTEQNERLLAALQALTTALTALESSRAAWEFGNSQTSQATGVQTEQGAPVVLSVEGWEFGNSQTSQREVSSPKLDFCLEWLRRHRDDMKTPGRSLEAGILMDGESISYKWWNQAKRALREEGVASELSK